MKVHDLIVGTVFLGLGVFVAAYSQTLVAPRNLSYGPGFFPLIVGTGLALVGIAIALNGFRSPRATPIVVVSEWAGSPRTALRFLILPAAIFFYIAVVNFFGFLATATIMLATIIAINGAPKRHALLAGFLVALVLNVGFASLLHVPLPWGPLTSVSGWLIW